MLHIVYFSNLTNNTHRFVEKLDWKGSVTRIPIKNEGEIIMNEPYIIISPSYGTAVTGHTPPQVRKFFKHQQNRDFCVGVIGAGNINFGDEYTRAADIISHKLQVPILYRFELAGTDVDVKKVCEGLTTHEQVLITKNAA